MKKKPRKNHLKIAFWVLFALAAGWVAFAPHSRVSAPPSVTVKVQQPPLQIDAPAPKIAEGEAGKPSVGGEEQGLPVPQAPPSENGSITVPVVPEMPEKAVPGKIVKIAIIIDDMGPELKNSERAIRLPPQVTLSFLPYAVRVRDLTKQARDKGHELLLHMPMEPLGTENPGKGALMVDLPLREVQLRFQTALASFTGFDGVNNHMGSKFTAYAEGMGVVVDEMQQRNLFFLDSRTNSRSIAEKIAQEKGLPSIHRDVFLDDDTAPESIRKQLAFAKLIARRKGYAVAIGHPHTSTLEVLEKWIAEAPGQGIELVPLNALVVRK